MIFLTADLHGDQMRLTDIIQQLQKYSGEKHLLVAGDFGFLLSGSRQEGFFLDDLERLEDITLVVVPGNHEGYPLIREVPLAQRHGAWVRTVRKNVLYVERGEVITLENKTFFCMGGAHSPDRDFRLENGWPWFEQELPSVDELANGWAQLETHGWCVDYVISHTAPESVRLEMGFHPFPEEAFLNRYLDEVRRTVHIKNKWFFGHYHLDWEKTMFGTQFVCVKNKLKKLM